MSKMLQIRNVVYERLKAMKDENSSFSDVITRLCDEVDRNKGIAPAHETDKLQTDASQQNLKDCASHEY
ncbi:MAG: hypothetical protein FIB08_12070 [Candidatus Methanoperedens sp.]|nr:hypothetical protein [Candidatus Methanoperedens sp.]